jgi:hypothetical protein
MIMMNSASSLAYVKTSCTLVAHFTSQQLTNVRTTATDIIVDFQTKRRCEGVGCRVRGEGVVSMCGEGEGEGVW